MRIKMLTVLVVLSHFSSPAIAAALDRDDALTWMHSQLPATTYIAVHAETLQCDEKQAIAGYFQLGLGRPASASDIKSYVDQLSKISLKDIRKEMANSAEYLNARISTEEFVARSYKFILLRPGAGASKDEIAYWVDRLKQISRKDLVQGFTNSPEFAQTIDCNVTDKSWGSVTQFYQPFKSMVETDRKVAYWRKDSMEDFYGELYTYDDDAIYLKSETFPYFHGLDAVNSWDARIDKTREFTQGGKSFLSNKGRLIAKRKISKAGVTERSLDTYACYSENEYRSGRCRQFQAGIKDRIFMTKLTNFSTVFDGENTDEKWHADAEFKNFDEVLVWNQEMNGNQGRERFFFGFKKGIYYGIIRWDNSIWVNNDWKVTDRTVGLKIYMDPTFSFDGIKKRGALVAPYILP